MSALLGGMVKQYSYTALTPLHWFHFTPVLCALAPSTWAVDHPAVSHLRGVPPLTFATCSWSGYSQSSCLVWRPCLLNLHPWSKRLAHMQLQAPAGLRDRFQAQGNPDRFVMLRACWSMPALHCNLHARFLENVRKRAKCRSNSKGCWYVMRDKDLFFCLLIC